MAKISKKKREELRARAEIARLTEELRPIVEKLEGSKSYQRGTVQMAKRTGERMGKLWADYARESIATRREHLERWANTRRRAEKNRQEWERISEELQKMEKIARQEVQTLRKFGEMAAAITKKAGEIAEVEETDSEEMGRLKLKQAKELHAETLELLEYYHETHRRERETAKTAQKLAEKLEKMADLLERWAGGEFDKFKA